MNIIKLQKIKLGLHYIESKINFLPLDLTKILNQYNIIAIPYSSSKYIKTLNDDIRTGDGFSTEENGQKIIYFNDKKGTYERRRFTLAHEIGHCLL